MWVWWVLGGLVAWFAVGLLVAVVIGRGIRLADEREARRARNFVVVEPQVEATAPVTASAVPARRRRIPLPAIGVVLAASAVALETAGYLAGLTGASGTAERLLSMDGAGSLPRLFVATLFGIAALLAFAVGTRIPGRRTWWTSVGLVAAVIAVVKAGGTIHVQALDALTDAVGTFPALALSVGLAVAVVGALWVLSRTERRDRRRVLGALAGYGFAAVGLSALSMYAAGTWGASWGIAATYVEESIEALAGVGFLMAVLIGVAPRYALPAAWPLRRSADPYTLDLPEQVPGRRAAGDPR